MKKDYFAILGIKPSASDKEIRSAYKKLAKKHHPDVNPNNKQAEEKFKEINEAHDVLTDPEKRRKWEAGDLDFESMFGAGPGGSGGRHQSYEFRTEGDLGSIFGDLFGRMGSMGGMGQPGDFGASPGADLQTEVTISFDEAVKGTTPRIPLARNVTCGTCHGAGSMQTGKSRRCPRCGGTGRVTAGTGPFRVATACPQCRGTGKMPGDPCTTCGGSGTVRSTETIQVRISPGAEDGSKVRVPGKGEAGGRGGEEGDLYVVLRVTPHAYFERNGGDILLDLPLTFSEAALGTSIRVPTIEGRVMLKVPPGSRSGQKLRLKGRGIPSRDTKTRGDQIVMLQIVTPKELDARSKKVLEEFDRLNPANPREGLGW